jgi:RNA polymerase sigma-70 factor (ECF subfamily)
MNNAQLRNELESCHRESYGWALMCCSRNAAEAENVLQTAYLKVLQGQAKFDGRAAFKTWFFSVIRRTASDIRRRERLRRLSLMRHEANAPTAGSRGFDEAIYQTEIQALFQHALAALSRRQQEVLQLVFYHDLSLAEVAAVLSVSIGSARTHYERGKKQLRRLMAEAGIFDESGLARKENPATLS